MWVPVPEKEHLFKPHLFEKQLSKHSISVYTELCWGVGRSFEAVVRPELDANRTTEEITKVRYILKPVR